ncbi:hypothetical protein V1511DRAFT_489266 [Dipodascopsis uninucleata]
MPQQESKCEVCLDKQKKYKCPRCGLNYCSVICFRSTERHRCNRVDLNEPRTEDNQNSGLELNPTITNHDVQMLDPRATLLNDPEITVMLQSKTLQYHLSSIYAILTDTTLTKEAESEARRTMAIKKLRELRPGGLEENVEVSSFVERVLSLL